MVNALISTQHICVSYTKSCVFNKLQLIKAYALQRVVLSKIVCFKVMIKGLVTILDSIIAVAIEFQPK